jgi:hypothetical protein
MSDIERLSAEVAELRRTLDGLPAALRERRRRPSLAGRVVVGLVGMWLSVRLLRRLVRPTARIARMALRISKPVLAYAWRFARRHPLLALVLLIALLAVIAGSPAARP